MKEKIKAIKADVIFSAIVCAVVGVVLIVWSEQTINIICMVLAGALVLMGAVDLIGSFAKGSLTLVTAMFGVLLIVLGVWLFMRPQYIAMVIPIVIGIVLVGHGIQDIMMAFETKGNGYEKWWSALLLGLISAVLGIICIVKAFGVVNLAMKFIGVALIYDGISDLWIVSRASRAAKRIKQEAEALDVDYKEVDD